MEEPKVMKINARVEPENYIKLKIKLIQQRSNFARWLNEQIKKEVDTPQQ